MEKFGEYALISDFMEEDVQEAMRGIMKYYMFLSNHTLTKEDLKMNLMFEEMGTLMLSYIDEPNLFGHWIYNHWDNIMYFFKVGFVAEDNIRPTISKNKAKRIKRDQGLPVEYKTLKNEFTIVVDAVEFQKILESIAKGDMRSLEFDQNKPLNIPSDSKESIRPTKTPRKARTRRPPSPLGDDSGDDSSGDQGKNLLEDRNRGKSPRQQSQENVTGIVSEPVVHTGLGGIKVDPPEMMNGSDKKQRDAQKFDGWTQRMETYISFNGIDLNTEKALTIVGFRLEEQALLVFNQFKREAPVKDFYTFMVHLRKYTIPSTSIDLLWKKWDEANLINSEGNSIGVYVFARILNDLQTRLRNKKGEMTISDEVKLRKFINTIPDYMQRVVKTKMTEKEYIYDEVIKIVESEEAVYKKDKGVNKEKKKRQYNPTKS